MPSTLVTLTTDFGLPDAFVGTMKGIILDISPSATIVDITHDVPRQDIRAGAYIFDSAYHYFPQDTVHVIVIDPTVGTNRRPIVVRTPTASFVCPDNGLLSYVFTREGGEVPGGEPFHPTMAKLPKGWSAYHLTNHRYWHHPISDTFHGRDIFAPVAGFLSAGEPPGAMGAAVQEINVFTVPRPFEHDGKLVGCVQHVDGFGNLITNIDADTLFKSNVDLVIEVGGHRVDGFARTYAEQGRGQGVLLGLIGSHGCLEIAVPYGNASKTLGIGVGDEVTVWRGSLTEA